MLLLDNLANERRCKKDKEYISGLKQKQTSLTPVLLCLQAITYSTHVLLSTFSN